MRKQRPLQFKDIILMFNILIFTGSSLSAWNQQRASAIFLMAFGFINAFYLLYLILFRKQYNQSLIKEVAIEQEAIEMIDDKGKALYIKTKQTHLENIIEIKLKEAFPDAYIIKNAYIPQSKGNYAQVDLIFIHSKGIFVIESKNITGTVKGEWDEYHLKLSHRSGNDYDITNPVLQNDMHIKRLKDILGRSTEQFYNIVVFGESTFCEIPLKELPFNARITFPRNVIKNIKLLIERSYTNLTPGELKVIYDDLLSNVEASEEIENNHIDYVKALKDKE